MFNDNQLLIPWKKMPWRSPRPTPTLTPPFAEIIPHKEEEEEALSVSDQRTLYLVNIFIVHTTRFLNSFSALCQQKLAHVHGRILRLDDSLTLLEAQLRSLPEIADFEAGPSNNKNNNNHPLLHKSSSLETSANPLSSSTNVHLKSSMLSVHPEEASE